jgi:2-polyprenyl-6-methoxyphenol hydroxylase-like FAD-dependent oxidoreductase
MRNSLRNKRILISGAGIGGPSLAWWLGYYSFNPTIVEQAPQLREGGYKIDLRGAAVEIIKHMDLYKQVCDASADMISAAFVDDYGKVEAKMDANFIGMREEGDIELMRGDLSKIIYEDTIEKCEYIFDDSIKSIVEKNGQLEVNFEKTAPRFFDLVIGADGIHSNVRSLAFGPELNFVQNLGDYFFAIFTTPNHLALDRQELFYAKADTVCNMYSTKNSKDAKALFVFKSPGFKYDRRDSQQQKNKVAQMFSNAKWQVPQLLKSMQKSTDFYFDTVNQIHMGCWSTGRVALVGDAAYAPSLASGQGSSMAIVGAYVLAGELYAAAGDYPIAYANYEKEMRPFIQRNQELGKNVKQMVPSSNWRLRLQLLMIRLMPYLPMSSLIIKKIREEVRVAANCIEIQDYHQSIY